MNDPKRVPLSLLPQHLDYIMNLLGTANLRYVDTAPIVQDIGSQIQALNMPKPVINGAEAQNPPAAPLQ